MTQDDVIKLAREAEFPVRGYYDESGATPAEIERFANAIEAKVKADLLAGAGEPVYWQYTSRLGNSYITEDRAAPSTDWTEVAAYTADQVAAAVLREREKHRLPKGIGGFVWVSTRNFSAREFLSREQLEYTVDQPGLLEHIAKKAIAEVTRARGNKTC